MPEELPGNWVKVDETTYRHTTGPELDIGETQGGWYRVDLVDDLRDPIGDGETLAEAQEVAREFMRENREQVATPV